MSIFVGASAISGSALISSLLLHLVRSGKISPAETREIFENALLILESEQALSPENDEAFLAARTLLEKNLAPKATDKNQDR